MIGIIGHMSGGKTYTAVRLMMQDLAFGHVVCTNVKLKCRGVTSYLGVPCVVWKQNVYNLSESGEGYHGIKLQDYDNYPAGSPRGSSDYGSRRVNIYYDEVSSVFDSITHSNNEEIKKVAVWARHTEKRGQFLFLIMQFPSELHKRLRNHVTEYLSCVNAANLRLPVVRVRLPPFLRNYIVVTPFLADGETAAANAKWWPIESKIYDCYSTGQVVFGGGSGLSVHAVGFDYTFNYLLNVRRWVWLLIVLQLLALLSLGLCCFSV